MRTTTLLASLSTLASLLAGQAGAQLVINEVDYDQPAVDTHEFIEVKNVDTSPYDLSNMAVVLVSGAGGGAAVYRVLHSPAWPMLAAGDHFVICGNGGLTANCDYDTLPDVDLVQNGPPDAVALLNLTDSTFFDLFSYEGDVPGFTETQGWTQEDLFYGGVGGSMEHVSASRYPDGIDTDNNSLDFVLACSTPGEANEPDTLGCPLSTGLQAPAVSASTFHAFTDPATHSIWLVCRQAGLSPVTFGIYTVDGRLLAERTTGGGSTASWAFHDEVHGVLVLRASTSTGVHALRIALP